MMPRRRRTWWILALFVVVGFGLYADVIINGIFIFDDSEYVTDNTLIRGLSYADLSDPRQMGYLSFALNYLLGGYEPQGYHVLNVAIHVVNASLVYYLLHLLMGVLAGTRPLREDLRTATAFLAALIFLVHPMMTMAVSYISQRFTSLATLFYLLAVTAYLMARVRFEADRHSRSGSVLYGCAMLSTLLAVRTKEITFTIPVVLAALELLALQGSVFSRRRFVFVVPFAVLAMLIPLAIFGPELGLIPGGEGIAEVTRQEKVYDMVKRAPFDYFFTQFRVVVTYMRLLLLPVGQRVIYDFRLSHSLFDWRVLLSLALILVVMAVAWRLWRRSSAMEPDDAAGARLASFGVLWFFVTLSVESSVIPIKDLIFEHRTYLPSVGFFAAASALIIMAARRIPGNRSFPALIGMVAFLVAVPLSAATIMRNAVWTDELKFWDDVVRKNPDKAIGYHNRGNAYGKLGMLDLALQDINRTIGFFPKNPAAARSYEMADFTPSNMAKTYMNRASVYLNLGLREYADADLKTAKDLVSRPPIDTESTMKAADEHAKRGEYQLAIEGYSKVLQWDAENLDALNNRSNAFSLTGNFQQATADLTKVITLYPDYAQAYHNRGVAYAWWKKKEEAVADFRKACEMGYRPACQSIEIAQKGGK